MRTTPALWAACLLLATSGVATAAPPDLGTSGWTAKEDNGSELFNLTGRPVSAKVFPSQHTCDEVFGAVGMTVGVRPGWTPAWYGARVAHSVDDTGDAWVLCTEFAGQRLVTVIAAAHPTLEDFAALTHLLDAVQKAVAPDAPAAPTPPPPPPPPPPTAPGHSLTLTHLHKTIAFDAPGDWEAAAQSESDTILRTSGSTVVIGIARGTGKNCDEMYSRTEAKKVDELPATAELLPPAWMHRVPVISKSTPSSPGNTVFTCGDAADGPVIVVISYASPLTSPDIYSARPVLVAIGAAFGIGSTATAPAAAPVAVAPTVASATPVAFAGPTALPPPSDAPPEDSAPSHHRRLNYEATVAFVRSSPVTTSTGAEGPADGNGVVVSTGRQASAGSFIAYEWRSGVGYDGTAGASVELRLGTGLALHGGPLSVHLFGGVGGDGIGLSRPNGDMRGVHVPFAPFVYARGVASVALGGAAAIEVAVEADNRSSETDGTRYEGGLVFHRGGTTYSLLAFEHDYGAFGKLVGGGLGFVY